MNDWIKEAITGLLGGILTSGGAYLTAVQETPLPEITSTQWSIICVTGAMGVFGAWKALLSRPPKRVEK